MINCKVIVFFLNWLLIAGLLTTERSAPAQQPVGKIPRLGFLSAGSRLDTRTNLSIEAFRQGLRDLGYVEGKTIHVEYRLADGKNERLPELLGELLGHKIDLLVASSATVARAAKKANVTIPIVGVNMGNITGLVDSLAKPGGNVTV